MALGQILTQSLSRNEYRKPPVVRSTASHSPSSLSKNLNRLISAAVVSPRFRALLLSDPVAALAAGYNGERFQLTPAEYAAVTSLRVTNVREFAAQLLRVLQYTAMEPNHSRQEARAEFQYAEIAS